MSRFQTWLKRICAVGLILLMQGPAMLTQEVAWAGMLVTYTRDRGLARGVAETFDGKHPCPMCAKAAKLKKDAAGENPSERRREEAMRFRLAWAEMVSSERLRMPAIAGCEVSVAVIAWAARDLGRGADAPASPPPEVG
jgi:hypothetical protein